MLRDCSFVKPGFLLNLAWVRPCSPPVPSLSIPPARGEQGDGPMDNEGFYVDNEGNMVQVLRKQKSAGIPPADFFTKIINSFEKMFDFFCSMW